MADARVLLRDAIAPDLPRLHMIEVASNPSPWSEAMLAGELSRPGARVRVLQADGVVAGFCCTWLVADALQVLEVAVDPAARRRGFGRRLLDDARADARSRGAVVIQLEVRAHNAPAIALYEALGFVRVGLRRRYYRDDGSDAVLMDLSPP